MAKYRWDKPKPKHSRVRPDAGWVDPEQLPKGPNGRALCRYCQKEVPPGRRTFCGEVCVDAWKIETQPAYAARRVEERDHGVCSICGTDTVIERQLARKDPFWYARTDRYAKRPPWPKSTDRRWWEMHHVVPVVLGGGGSPLDKLATACVVCHKKLTKKLVRYLRKKKADPQPELF